MARVRLLRCSIPPARLPQIKAQVLIIVGAQDLATPPVASELVHAQLPGSKLLVLDPAAHIASVSKRPKIYRWLCRNF